ncbi:MAG: AIPR family protein [Acetatifactor sp.]|nr:AIPR family protein [Acetatifactor sp.]
MNYIEKFKTETGLINKFGEGNAYLCWVMALYLDRNDVIGLATDDLTDGKNDKKIDFVDLDRGNGKITLAQGYYSKKDRDEAPANKASDMNTAIAWLLSGDISKVPDYMREIIIECREAIKANEITLVDAVYVHNLPESKNCKSELKTIETHQSKIFEQNNIEVVTHELGRETIETLYVSKESQILVTDSIEMEGLPLFEESAEGWKAYIFSVSGNWLYNIFRTYGDDLFSANYRGFLGIGKRKKINNSIRQTAEMEPENFWVYNNGITILTLGISDLEKGNKKIDGISIINGAQTTGSISMVDENKKENLKKMKVLCRVIKCDKTDLIPAIVKANNTQNEITSWDRYSNDPIQVSLRDKFAMYGKEYSLKRGFDDVSDRIGIYTIAQPVLAFEGNYMEANRGINNIFDQNYLYKAVFEEKNARHLLLIYSLAKMVDDVKYEIKELTSSKDVLKDDETIQVSMFRNLKFKMFFIAVIAECIEVIVDFKVDKKKIAFTEEFAKKEFEVMKEYWKVFIKSVLSFMVAKLNDLDINVYIQDKEKFGSLCREIKALFKIMMQTGQGTYDELKSVLWQG